MINYKNKDVGMSYMVGDTEYTIKHDIVRLINYKETSGKVKMHLMFNDGKEVVCDPFLDPYIKLQRDMSLKIAYIDLNKGTADDIRIHGYEKSDIDTSSYPEAKLKPFKDESLNVEELYQRFINISNAVKNTYLKNVLGRVIEIYGSEYKVYPAGTSVHHSYRGGLLQHTLSVAELAYLIGNRFSNIDIDLILTGALLHDIGKIFEYNEDGSISDIGKYRDHISIGVEIISNICRDLEVPEELKNQLVHIILSHHGKEEWGSPKKPGTEEAFIVHIADYIDSQLLLIGI